MRHICIAVFLILSLQVFSQNETNHWYFGDQAGLDFSQGGFTVKNDGAMDTPAGCASISDGDGNLLMYTNGASVWNKNHELMENGTGLAGEIGLTQTSLIVPNPINQNRYYIFTNRATINPNPVIPPGIYYSEVEFSNEHPLGNVILKNVRITQSASGKLTGVHHADGKSVWVLGVGGSAFDQEAPKDTFFVIKVDGVNVSVERQIKVDQISSKESIGSTGAMKFSPNAKVIGAADYENNWIFTFNFDHATGMITAKKEYNADLSIGVFLKPYGLEFSPDSQLLYHTALQNNSRFVLVQTDLNGNEFTFSHLPFSEAGTFPGSVQLANNEKIYVSYTANDDPNDGLPVLGVIQNPNVFGSEVRYTHRGVRINLATVKKGLPNFLQSYFQTRILVENECALVPIPFAVESYTTILEINWDFGDGTQENNLQPAHAYSNPGTYIVRADVRLASGVQTVYKELTVFALPQLNENQFLEQCDSDMDGLSVFNLTSIRPKLIASNSQETLDFFLSLEDAQSNTNSIENPESFSNTIPNQTLFVRATNDNNCSSITSFTVQASFVDLGVISPVFTCENSDTEVSDGQGLFDLAAKRAAIYQELNIDPSTRLRFFETLQDAQSILNELEDQYVSASKTIWMRAEDNTLGCSGIEAVPLVVNTPTPLSLEDNYTICLNPSVHPPVSLRLDSGNDRYEWYDPTNTLISTEQAINITQLGVYTAVVYKTENGIECSQSKSFTVGLPDPPTFLSLEADTSSLVNTITVQVNGSSSYAYSLDNINFFGSGTSHLFTNVPAGIQTVYVKDRNACEPSIQQTVSVIGYPAFFSPNNDGVNDFWKVTGASSEFFQSINLQIVDRFGKLVASITDIDSPGWDGTYGGEEMPPSSYWFKAELVDLNDNIIVKVGNFSLVRNQ